MKYISLLTFFVGALVSGSSDMFLTCHRPEGQLVKNRSPKYLRMQEKVARNVPCDLGKGGYCNIPGDHYPW
jgi:hypothetical protein